MKTSLRVVVLSLGVFLAFSASLYAGELKGSYTPEVAYVGVDGDAHKFRAHHWMNTGIEGGIGEYEFKDEDAWNGASLEMEGHALVDNADYKHEFSLRKEDVGFLVMEVNRFRKYYDSKGGVSPGFTSLRLNDSNRDLFVDIAKFGVELGITRPNLPEVDLGYEYESKEGTKSRLSWTTVTEGTVGRKIGPSWQEIDEDVHTFTVDAAKEFSGFTIKNDNKWEHAESHNLREEKSLSNTTTASQKVIRDQVIEPKSDYYETVFHLDKWFFKDKFYAATAYRYSQVENSELENIYEMDENRVLTNFSAFSEQVRDSTATNQWVSHTWTASTLAILNKALTAQFKFKGESFSRDSQSTYNKDKAPSAAGGGTGPNGVIDDIAVSNNTEKVNRWGEGLTLRYTGIERVSLFSETELEQTSGNLYEDRIGISASEVFTRQTRSYFYRGSETLGTQMYPWDWFNLTAQYRYRKDNMDYDDQFETVYTSGAKSAFMDGGRYEANEFSTRASFYPANWLQPSLRYQLRFQENTWYTEDNPLRVTSETISNIYTANVMIQPMQSLILNESVCVQDFSVATPAEDAGSFIYPRFEGDATTFGSSADFLINSDTTLNATFNYTTTYNYEEAQVSYRSDFDRYDFVVGLRLNSLIKNAVVEPKYAFYKYTPNTDAEGGEYDAHVAWLSVKLLWG